MAQSWTQVILVAIIKISCCAKILQQEPKEETITSRFWSTSLPLLYTYKIKWIPKIILRKIHVLLHTHKNTEQSISSPHSDPSPGSILRVWSRGSSEMPGMAISFLHPLFQQSTLNSFPLLRPFTWNSTIIQVALHLFSVRVLAPVL